MSHDDPPNAPNDRLTAIRSALESAGFHEPRLRELLRVPEIPSIRDRVASIPEWLRRTRGGSTLETLARLFLMRQAVPSAAAIVALAPAPMEIWIEAGLLEFSGDTVRSRVEIAPYREFLIASDWDAPRIEPVMGIASTTRALDLITIRRPFGRVLDLGTGSGIQAILARRHSPNVWAADRNPRAVAMARFNASLNGIEGIEFRVGSLFEPIGDQRFDLIVCNPPFLIGSEPGPIHSRSGRRSDDFCRELVREAAGRLNVGGYCQILCNWICSAPDDPDSRLASWFEGLGCDTLALRVRVEDAASYAMTRAREQGGNAGEIASRFDRIIQDLDEQNVQAIGYGAITFQRVAGRPNAFLCESMPTARGPCGDSIVRRLRHAAFLRDHGDDARLLAARLQASPGLHWETSHDWTAQGWVLGSSRLTSNDPLAITGQADRDLVRFLEACRGDQTLRDHALRIARESERDPGSLIPEFLRVVRRLIAVGHLEPVDYES